MNGQFELGSLTPERYFYGIAIVLGVLFFLITPSEAQSELHPVIHLFQWQLQTVLPMSLLILSHLVLHRLDWFERLNPWLRLFLSGVVGASLFAPPALGIDLWLLEETLEPGTFWPALIEEWGHVILPVTLTWVVINAPWLSGFQLQRRDSPAATAATTSQRASGSRQGLLDSPSLRPRIASPDFYGLMPGNVRGELIMLKAELHYLEVITDKGKALILYNLKDAMSELDHLDGFQPHRSFWVSAKHVERFEPKGRQGVLHLEGGLKVPVSRRRMNDIRETICL